MPLDPEDLKAIIDGVEASLLTKLDTQIKETVNTTVTGATSRLRKEFQTDIGNVQSKFDSIGDVVKQNLESVLDSALSDSQKTAGQSSGQGQQSAGQQQQPAQTPPDDKLAAVLSQIAALQAENQSLKGNFEKAQLQATESQKAAARAQLEAQYYDNVRDRVVDPAQALMAMERFAGIKEHENQFVIEQKDEWGNITVVPIFQKDPKTNRDFVDSVLAQDRFSIHAKARPGGGLNSQPGQSQSNIGKDKPQYFDPDGKNTRTETLVQVANTSGLDTLVGDLLKTAG
jgi:hypothetical protein